MPRDARRAQLLDTARDVVEAEGFSALTIDGLAAAAEVTRTVVYQHFTDLAGLMTALLDRESAIAFAGIRSVDTEGADVARGILAYLHAAPDSWRIILRSTADAPPGLRRRLDIGRSYARAVAARQLAAATGLRVDPDAVTVRILLAAVEELARNHLDHPDRCTQDQAVRHIESLAAWAARAEIDVMAESSRTSSPM